MSNEDLDSHIRRLTLGNPHLGQRTVQGLLRAEGFVIQRERVAESLIRVDAAAVAMRWCQSVRRRTYQVPGPNALWHIDGNHKLIRWGIVIHGAIDGFSRMVVFLNCSTNNKAAAVVSLFFGATTKYGVPSRVRCDHGVENMDVAAFMVMYRGPDRGSCITGRSVHNQRIERFWRDLFHGCTSVYHSLFAHLENEGLIRTDDNIQMWCFHYVFVPRLQRDLLRFQVGWNNHRMRSVHGKSPLQQYTCGILANRGRGQRGVDDLFFEPDVEVDNVDLEELGVDWDDPLPEEENNSESLSVDCPLTVDQLGEIQRQIDPLGHSEDSFGIDLYLRAVTFCLNL